MVEVSSEYYCECLGNINSDLVEENVYLKNAICELIAEIAKENAKLKNLPAEESFVKGSPAEESFVKGPPSEGPPSIVESDNKLNFLSAISQEATPTPNKESPKKVNIRVQPKNKNQILHNMLDKKKNDKYKLFEAETLRLIGDRKEGVILLPDCPIQLDSKGVSMFKLALSASSDTNTDYENTFWFKESVETSFDKIFNTIHPGIELKLPGWADKATFRVKT